MKRLALFIEIERANGCWWLQRDGVINKGLASVKFYDNFSLHFSITAVRKTVSKQVYGRQMFLYVLKWLVVQTFSDPRRVQVHGVTFYNHKLHNQRNNQ